MPNLTMGASGKDPSVRWFRGDAISIGSPSFGWKLLGLLKEPASLKCLGGLWLTPKGELRLDDEAGKSNPLMLAEFPGIPEGGYSKQVVAYSPEVLTRFVKILSGLTAYIAPTILAMDPTTETWMKAGFENVTFVGSKPLEQLITEAAAPKTPKATATPKKALGDYTLEELQAAQKAKEEAAAMNPETPAVTKVPEAPVHSMEELTAKQKKQAERDAKNASR